MFLKYSGFYIIFFSWIFMVVPYLIYRQKYKLLTISDTVSVERVRKVINFGILGAALSQMLFIYYLITRLNLNKPTLGAIIFIIGSLSFAIASIFDVKRFKSIHHKLVKIYFSSIAIGATLISISFRAINYRATILCIFDIFLMYMGAWFFYKRKMLGEAEVWVILFSTIWALIIYYFII